jgi:hypothetical protein
METADPAFARLPSLRGWCARKGLLKQALRATVKQNIMPGA